VVGLDVRVDVGVALGVVVGLDVRVDVGVALGVAVGLDVRVDVGVALGVVVGLDVWVDVGVALGVAVGLDVRVDVGVALGVAVGLDVRVDVGVALRVGVADGLGIILTNGPSAPCQKSAATRLPALSATPAKDCRRACWRADLAELCVSPPLLITFQPTSKPAMGWASTMPATARLATRPRSKLVTLRLSMALFLRTLC
jgi:hypothetical protein